MGTDADRERSLTIRGTEEQKNRFDEIADKYPKKGDAFEALLCAYEESKALADGEARLQMEHIRSLCDNICGAFQLIMTSQNAELAEQEKKADLRVKELQEQLETRKQELSDALDRVNALQAELEQEKREKNALQESNTALKDQNSTREKYVDLLETRVKELEKKPATKKTGRAKGDENLSAE